MRTDSNLRDSIPLMYCIESVTEIPSNNSRRLLRFTPPLSSLSVHLHFVMKEVVERCFGVSPLCEPPRTSSNEEFEWCTPKRQSHHNASSSYNGPTMTPIQRQLSVMFIVPVLCLVVFATGTQAKDVPRGRAEKPKMDPIPYVFVSQSIHQSINDE